MVEGGGAGSESGSRSKLASSFESAGGRLRFQVELRPGETTIVSWKKLLKEATSNQPNGTDQSVVGPSSEAQLPTSQTPLPPSSEASSSKRTVPEDEAKDSQAQAGPNRLNNVIERIERMYAGNGSSDEEDVVLDDVPDDDEYDTDDSFIDDAELDDYFQVDNSAIKHDGFFVNRGKLERIEPSASAIQQPKKRRRKDSAKSEGGLDDGHKPSKHVKIGDKGRKASSTEKKTISQSNRVAVPNAQGSKIPVDPSGTSNGDPLGQDKDADQQKTGVLSKSYNNKQKEGSELQDNAVRRSIDKSSHEHKSQSGKPLTNADEFDQSMLQKEKAGLAERFDLNVPASKDSLLTYKVPLMQRKEGSSVRPKSTMLEKAIKELEKTVTESRPPSREVHDPDNSSQAIKRRLPPEIKQKLAKVARLAQVSYGKIPKDLINRLMSIVGHLMQLRTLKRNLKVMANMGLSVKQEKEDQLQKIKQEVADMVKLRIVYMKSKVVEQQSASLDDFQEAGQGDRETLKRKYSIDNTLENKICDLYDLYVERLEEESGPPVRRLYEELAALWPSGVMDTEGVKRAISCAKDRRRALYNRRKDQEKIKKAKVLTPKTDDGTRVEGSNSTQISHYQEKSTTISRDHSASSTSKSNLNAAVAHSATCAPVSSGTIQDVDKGRQEKTKGNSSRNPGDAGPTDVLPKKKVKRKPEAEMVEGQSHPEKLPPQGGERHKHHKPTTTPVTKSTIQLAAPSNSEQLN